LASRVISERTVLPILPNLPVPNSEHLQTARHRHEQPIMDAQIALFLTQDGLITGAVIGAGQWLVSRGRLRPAPWILATALGMGLGLLLGATIVGFRTSLADLAVMGAVSGLMHGVAQTLALPAQTKRRWWWAAAMPLLWALGWTVTTLAGIPVDEQFTIFGASGAVTFSALSGLLLHGLLPVAALYIGALIIAVLNNGLTLMNVSFYWQLVIKGAVIILAVMLDKLRTRGQAG
jgi:hypothetical protein